MAICVLLIEIHVIFTTGGLWSTSSPWGEREGGDGDGYGDEDGAISAADVREVSHEAVIETSEMALARLTHFQDSEWLVMWSNVVYASTDNEVNRKVGRGYRPRLNRDGALLLLLAKIFFGRFLLLAGK